MIKKVFTADKKDHHDYLDHFLWMVRGAIVWASPLLILALQQLQETGTIDYNALYGLLISLIIELLERSRRVKK